MPRLTEPLRFTRHFVEKPVWGGRALEGALGIDLPPEAAIGETWEVVDREGENSVVAAGPHAGRTLGELVREHGDDLLGRSPATPHGRFPLLVKFLDASSNLSVQVHPDDAGAERQGSGSEPKTEAWYFVQAREGAGVWCGLREGTERAALERDLGRRAVVDHLSWWDARAGEALMVPGGAIHAIGAGVVLLEVQQNSDTTWRIYDWDRVDRSTGEPRPVHLEEAAEVVRHDLPARAPVPSVFLPQGEDLRAAPLARCRHFGMTRLEVQGASELSTGGQFQILVVVGGSGALASGGGETHEVRPGSSYLIPAAAENVRFEPGSDGLDVIQLVGAG
ncbi:MAG: type I phosphomannose isomerase catalytic subunit [Planctomycetota bacterium]